MTYDFVDSSIDLSAQVLPNSEKIHPLLLKNNLLEAKKAIEFLASDEKFLYVHAFLDLYATKYPSFSNNGSA